MKSNIFAETFLNSIDLPDSFEAYKFTQSIMDGDPIHVDDDSLLCEKIDHQFNDLLLDGVDDTDRDFVDKLFDSKKEIGALISEKKVRLYWKKISNLWSCDTIEFCFTGSFESIYRQAQILFHFLKLENAKAMLAKQNDFLFALKIDFEKEWENFCEEMFSIYEKEKCWTTYTETPDYRSASFSFEEKFLFKIGSTIWLPDYKRSDCDRFYAHKDDDYAWLKILAIIKKKHLNR